MQFAVTSRAKYYKKVADFVERRIRTTDWPLFHEMWALQAGSFYVSRIDVLLLWICHERQTSCFDLVLDSITYLSAKKNTSDDLFWHHAGFPCSVSLPEVVDDDRERDEAGHMLIFFIFVLCLKDGVAAAAAALKAGVWLD